MELIVNGTVVNEPLSDGLIEKSIRSLTGEGDSFAILSESDMTYIQASGDPHIGFILEYQVGSVDDHYSCTNANVDTALVVDAFQRYWTRDTRWRTDLTWEKEGLGAQPASVGRKSIVWLIGLAVAAFVLWKMAGSV